MSFLITLTAFMALETYASAEFETVADGYVLGDESDDLRIHFIGNYEEGFDIVFERRANGGWQHLAGFPPGQIWTVYTIWSDSWYREPQHFKATKIEAMDNGRAKASSHGTISGQEWRFSDVYSLENGLIKIERTFEHLGTACQSEITLATRVCLAVGDDPRVLIPGVIYNNNPSALPTKPVPHIAYVPKSVGLYEEHRLPVPMVNFESTVQGKRLYGSLLSIPSHVLQGHKADQWWSLGLEWGEDYVDLLSVSGAVATNGFKSTLYGHRNGFGG